MSTFITSRGVEIRFRPIPQMLIDRVQQAHKLPDPPTYEIKTVTGAVETHAHDATTVQTDEEKHAWAEYLAAHALAVESLNRAFMRMVFLRGVEVDAPQNDEWAREQELLGITVPTDALERRLHWLETEVVATVGDADEIVRGVLAMSGVPQEALAQAEDTFRHPPQRDAVESITDPQEQMVNVSEIRAGDASIKTGTDHYPVRRIKRRG